MSRHLSVAEPIRRAINTLIESSNVVDAEERLKGAIEIVRRFLSGKHDISEKHDLHLTDAYGK